MFQFRKVQLIHIMLQLVLARILVSIPQGPINTEKTDEEHYTNSEVSIPQGPINT